MVTENHVATLVSFLLLVRLLLNAAQMGCYCGWHLGRYERLTNRCARRGAIRFDVGLGCDVLDA
jgi:hypothetical protein